MLPSARVTSRPARWTAILRSPCKSARRRACVVGHGVLRIELRKKHGAEALVRGIRHKDHLEILREVGKSVFLVCLFRLSDSLSAFPEGVRQVAATAWNERSHKTCRKAQGKALITRFTQFHGIALFSGAMLGARRTVERPVTPRLTERFTGREPVRSDVSGPLTAIACRRKQNGKRQPGEVFIASDSLGATPSVTPRRTT